MGIILDLLLTNQKKKLGICASSTCEVQLENCIVSEDAILGELGKGYQIAIQTLNKGRVGIGAQMVGCAQGAFDITRLLVYNAGRGVAMGQADETQCSMAKLVSSE